MREIEVLFKVSGDLRSILAKMGHFESRGAKNVVDTYFVDPKRDCLKPGPKLSLKECCRLRRSDKGAALTYKVDHFDALGKWSYSDEHEVEVSDADKAEAILRHLGLEPMVTIDLEKHVFVDGCYEIVVENVKKLGVFLEVERISVPDSAIVEDVKDDIRRFIAGLGIACEEVHAGKPELMLRSLAKK